MTHCTGVFLVWLPRNGSVSDLNSWGEVCIVGDVCASASFLCVILGLRVFRWVSVFKSSWVLNILIFSTDVSGGCSQTSSMIGRNFVSMVCDLSVAGWGWRSGSFCLHFEYFHLSCFGCFFAGLDSLLPIFCSREAVHWPHSLQNSISLWSSLFFNMFHRVGKQFLAVFLLYYCFCCYCCCSVWVIGATIFVSRTFLSVFNLFFFSGNWDLFC